jgi:hypothetical protein
MVYPILRSIRNGKIFSYYRVMPCSARRSGKEASAMIPFTKRFPELGKQETRVMVFPDDGAFPAGRYAFCEMYCEEEDCDCRRVILCIIEESCPEKVWATISFGWDPSGSHTGWTDLELPGATASGAFLDPICPQSEHAAEFLDLFEWIIARDPSYVERLKRHYAMFKAAQPIRKRSWETPDPAWRAKRPKLDRKQKRKRSR